MRQFSEAQINVARAMPRRLSAEAQQALAQRASSDALLSMAETREPQCQTSTDAD